MSLNTTTATAWPKPVTFTGEPMTVTTVLGGTIRLSKSMTGRVRKQLTDPALFEIKLDTGPEIVGFWADWTIIDNPRPRPTPPKTEAEAIKLLADSMRKGAALYPLALDVFFAIDEDDSTIIRMCPAAIAAVTLNGGVLPDLDEEGDVIGDNTDTRTWVANTILQLTGLDVDPGKLSYAPPYTLLDAISMAADDGIPVEDIARQLEADTLKMDGYSNRTFNPLQD